MKVSPTPCPSCEAIPDANARFCKHCGGKLAQNCAKCGEQLDEDARFCKHCGTQSGSSKPESPKPKPKPSAEKPAAKPRPKRQAPASRPSAASKPANSQFTMLMFGMVAVAIVVGVLAWMDQDKKETTPNAAAPPHTPTGLTPTGLPPAPSGPAVYEGMITIDPGLKKDAPTQGVIYVMARIPGQAGGPPLAAIRVDGNPAGTPFSIGPGDIMLEGIGGLDQPVLLSARWDQDGDASSKQPGDMIGQLTTPTQPGAKGVVIVLDTRAVEDKKAGVPSALAPSTPAVEGEEPASEPASEPAKENDNAAAPTGDTIKGTLTIASELQASAPKTGIFFIMARLAPVAAGPPLAVLRIPASAAPTPFSIGPENVMLAGTKLDKPVYLSVRWDQDGNAMSKQAGDLTGKLETPISPGTNNVALILNTRLAGP